MMMMRSQAGAVRMTPKQDEKGGLLEVRRMRERGGQCGNGEHTAKGVTKSARVKRSWCRAQIIRDC